MSETTADKIERLFGSFPKRNYPKGQIIIYGGENPDYIFYLTKGRVRKYDITYRGDEVIVNLFKPQSFFPMSWAISKLENKYFYKTETETELHIVPPNEALRIIKENPDIMLDLLKRLYSGMEGIMGRIVQLMSGTAKSRLMYELIVECRRSGKIQPNGSVLISATEADLAARSGLSRETVSREIHKIKADNLVKVTPLGIQVIDLELLEEKFDLEA